MLSSKQITNAILQRFSRDKGYVSLAEFGIGDTQTGSGAASRRVDAVALSYWHDNECHVFEVKVSRADFLAEIANPEKRQPAFDMSSHAWFVCAPNVCDPSEVPEGWGYVLCDERCSLRTIIKPPWRDIGLLPARLIARFIERSADPIPYTSRVYLTYEGREITATDLQKIVNDEVNREMRRVRSISALADIRQRCYECRQAGERGYPYYREQIEQHVSKLLEEGVPCPSISLTEVKA